METLLTVVVIFFAGYGLKALGYSITSYIEDISSKLSAVEESSDRNANLHERSIEIMEQQLEEQRAARGGQQRSNVVDIHAPSQNNQNSNVEFEDEPVAYQREG